MCLVAVAWKSHPRWRLVLAGNRDEFYARPSTALARWPAPQDGVLAGRDLRSNGTWMGVGAGRRVAVVTNVRDGRNPREGRSRGSLVADYLAAAGTARAHAESLTAEADRYSPFNLLLIDDLQCRYLCNHPPAGAALAPGVHGLSNGPLGTPWPKVDRLVGVMSRWLAQGAESFDPIWQALADERPADDAELPDTGVGLALERMLSSPFIRSADYGTCASTVIAIDHEGRGWIRERRFGRHGVPLEETTLGIGETP